MLQKSHSFTFKGEKIVVNFPTVGQLIDMESLKQLLTGNRYSAMSTSNLKSMLFALDLVDAIVFFQVMCPKVKRIADIDDYAKADPIVAKELVKIYKEEIYSSWYSEVIKELYSYGDAATGTADNEAKG